MATAMGETPRQKFDRLVSGRIRNIEESIRRFSQLSNAYIYEYEKADVEHYFASILDTLDDAKRRFDDGLRRAERLRQRQEAPSSPAEGSLREQFARRAR